MKFVTWLNKLDSKPLAQSESEDWAERTNMPLRLWKPADFEPSITICRWTSGQRSTVSKRYF